MAVCGIDFGSQSVCSGLARRGGIDIVTNETDQRQTPSLVSFNADERYIGEAALPQVISNAKNTISMMKTMVGRDFDDIDFQEEISQSKFPFKVVRGDKNDACVEVFYAGSKKLLTMKQVLGMLFANGKKNIIRFAEIPASTLDCVVAVPGYFSDSQRRAIVDSAAIGGVNVHHIINDTTAAALQWGFYNLELPEKDPVHVMFIDIGYTGTQVSVVDLSKDKLVVKSSAYDSTLGGNQIDLILMNHFAGAFEKKYGMKGILDDVKARLRLARSVERLKKVLSANPEATIQVEYMMNDIDVQGHLTRVEFNQMIQPLVDRLAFPIQKALIDAEIQPKDLKSVELIGNSSRVPAFIQTIETMLGREIARTLNAAEAVAKGATLFAALTSPLFKVRDFSVTDSNLHSITLSWQKEDSEEQDTIEIFPEHCAVPSSKMLTFYRKDSFVLSAEYTNDSKLLPGTSKFIGKWAIALPSPGSDVIPSEDGSRKIKVKVRLNESGYLNVASATLVEEIPPEPEKVEEKKEEKKDEPMKEKEEVAEPEPMETEGPSKKAKKEGEEEEKVEEEKEEETKEEEKKEEEKKVEEKKEEEEPKKPKKRYRKTGLALNSDTNGLSLTDLNLMIEEEGKMAAQDNLIVETNNARNALEEYCYNMKEKLEYGGLKNYMKGEDRVTFMGALDAAKNWLYESDEAMEGTKSTFLVKLKELMKYGDPVQRRWWETENRAAAVKVLNAKIHEFKTFAKSTDKKYEHIDGEDKEKVVKLCNDIETWLQNGLELASGMPAYEDPPIWIEEMSQKLQWFSQELESTCRPIESKPIPPPPKEEPPKGEEKKKDVEMKDAEVPPLEGDDPDAERKEEKEVKQPQQMDLD